MHDVYFINCETKVTLACFLFCLSPVSAGFLRGLLFDPTDGDEISLRNVDWLSRDYTALHSIRYNSSFEELFRVGREHGGARPRLAESTRQGIPEYGQAVLPLLKPVGSIRLIRAVHLTLHTYVGGLGFRQFIYPRFGDYDLLFVGQEVSYAGYSNGGTETSCSPWNCLLHGTDWNSK
jgi:hypothetical protein